MESETHIPLEEALAGLARLPELFAVLFERGDVSIELFAPRGEDTQTPHDRDEIYIVARGTGVFLHEGARITFGPGDFLFVPAWDDHRFESFSEDFATWVVFFGAVRPKPA